MTRRTSNLLRTALDSCVPPVLRDRWPFTWATRLWLGAHAPVDFKRRAFGMSDREFVDAYRALGGAYIHRKSDTTPQQAEWLVSQTCDMPWILEIGPGSRELTAVLARLGRRVVTLDLFARPGLKGENVVGVAERLPFRDKSVDILIAAHVIEHVRSLTRTFLEFQRVARDRVIIITPKQRFSWVTFDYHLQFFYSLDHLSSHVPGGHCEGTSIDGDLCLVWRMH